MDPVVPAAPPVVVETPKVDSALYQGLVRAARYLGATIISAVVVELPQLMGFFSIDPRLSGLIVLVLGGFLQGLGKVLRGPSVDVPSSAVVLGGSSDVPETAPVTPTITDKLPF